MGTLVVPLIHLKEAQSSGFFYAKERGNGRGRFYKNSEALRRISLIMNMFTAGTISLKALEQHKPTQEGVRETEHFALLQFY